MMTLPTDLSGFTHQDYAELAARLRPLNEVTVADYIGEVDERYRFVIFQLLEKDKAADVFAYLDSSDQEDLIHLMDDEAVRDLMLGLETDDLADVLGELPANLVTKALRNFSPDRRKILNQLLHYPEDAVGSFMTVDYLHLHEGATAEEAVRAVRSSPLASETLNWLYVTNPNRRFEGTVPLWKILQAPPTTPIETLMDSGELSLQTLEDQEEAAGKFQRYGVSALPVVDSERRIVGVVTADDMMHVLQDEADEDYLLMQGVQPSRQTYLETSVWDLARQRFMWLLVLLISAVFTGLVIQRYEAVLAASVALTAYIPMLMDSGGNSGSQSSTLIIRSMALGDVELKDAPKVLWKELRIGLLVGVALAAVNFARIVLMDRESMLIALIVSLTLAVTVTLAKLVGGLLPMIAKRFGADPAVMAGPFVTTIVDTLALLVFFRFATWLMG